MNRDNPPTFQLNPMSIASPKFFLALLAVLSPALCATAADKMPPRPDSPSQFLEFWKSTPELLSEQTRLASEKVRKTLAANPPSTNPSEERQLALHTLDGIFHDTRLDATDAFPNILEAAAADILKQLKQARPATGIRISKLYNHGFIIETPSSIIGIDLVRGKTADKKTHRQLISDALMAEIAGHLDILLVTHRHPDHADLFTAGQLAKRFRPVIAPTGLWENTSPNIIHLREAARDFSLPGKNASLRIRAYPGYQGWHKETPNNLYEITTPEGLTLVHTGDHWCKYEENDMLAAIGKNKTVDLLFLNTWGLVLPEIADAVNRMAPALVISGHENELGHGPDKREPFWLSPRLLGQLRAPSVIMAPGETFHSNSEQTAR